ncbi:MAG: AraC family transcriptional regulator [Planctomycetota bacterium]
MRFDGLLSIAPRFGAGANPVRMRHRHEGQHELLLCLQGRGRQLTVRGEEACARGDVFFFPAGIAHMSATAAGETMQVQVVQFEEECVRLGGPAMAEIRALLQRLVERGRRDSRLPVSAAGAKRLRELLTAIQRCWEGAGGHSEQQVLLLQALLLIGSDPGAGLQPRSPFPDEADCIERICALIEQHYHSPLGVADALALCPWSRSRFHQLFRRHTGRSFAQAVIERRIDAACQLLRAGGHGMIDIALSCGFGSQSHFSVLFSDDPKANEPAPESKARRIFDSHDVTGGGFVGQDKIPAILAQLDIPITDQPL